MDTIGKGGDEIAHPRWRSADEAHECYPQSRPAVAQRRRHDVYGSAGGQGQGRSADLAGHRELMHRVLVARCGHHYGRPRRICCGDLLVCHAESDWSACQDCQAAFTYEPEPKHPPCRARASGWDFPSKCLKAAASAPVLGGHRPSCAHILATVHNLCILCRESTASGMVAQLLPPPADIVIAARATRAARVCSYSRMHCYRDGGSACSTGELT